MIFLHISDLHIGKQIYGESRIEEQKFILEQIVGQVKEQQIPVVLIAGDIYDKAIPSIEGLQVFEAFLKQLIELEVDVLIIAGNHDSGERLSFGKEIFEAKKIHIVGKTTKALEKIVLKDEYGEICFYLLPFMKPFMISHYFEEEIKTYEQAIKMILASSDIDDTKRNVLLAHQFVTWQKEATRSDSEQLAIGGVDEIDARLFFDFDYVALGHLHAPQRIGKDYIRYSGSPLKYSFSEVRQNKSITKVTLKEKGNFSYELIPLQAMKEMKIIKGQLKDLLEEGKKEGGSEDYIQAILTDQEPVYDAIGQLRGIYPNILDLQLTMKQSSIQYVEIEAKETFDKRKWFTIFFEQQVGRSMTQQQEDIVQKIWERLGE